MTAAYLESIISRLIEECNNEADIDKKVQLLYKINSKLPKLSQENIPGFKVVVIEQYRLIGGMTITVRY